MIAALFSRTPSITAVDSRGLVVRTIEYLRHPDDVTTTRAHITRHRYSAQGFPSSSVDPRLHGFGIDNLQQVNDLAGRPIRIRNVDAGTQVTLHDAARRPAVAVVQVGIDEHGADDFAEAVSRIWRYEDSGLPGRLLSVTEQVADEAPRISERFVWSGVSPQERQFNLAGRCVSHYGSEGVLQLQSVALSGVSLRESRCLLVGADEADRVADWQGATEDKWQALLAEERWSSVTSVDAFGATLASTDAKGHTRRLAYDVTGQLKGSWLTTAGGVERVIVKGCVYSACGRKLCEEHGNQVLTRYEYEAQTERLARTRTERPVGHPAGARLLLDLHYEYDPQGNVVRVANEAEAVRFWRNQRVAPEMLLSYDSLYRLASAKGREMASAARYGATLPLGAPLDDVTYTNYLRSHDYDAAGNLTQIRHVAPASQHNFTMSLVVSERSNRALPDSLAGLPSQVDALFTAGGMQRALSPGQALSWTVRGHLSAVESAGGELDEFYRHDSQGLRVLKLSTRRNDGGERLQRTHYLPGLELRTADDGARTTSSLQVLICGEAGAGQVRLLHWDAGKPADIENDQLRFSYDDRLGSSLLELDQDGQLLSREEYYPYGGTSLWAGPSQVEADCKSIRYSGKERDASGLYYYGQRYYQPWSGRWLSADPAGTADGLNLFRAMRNNPVSLKDGDGLIPTLPGQEGEPDGAKSALLPIGAIYNLPNRQIPYGDPFNQGYRFIAVDLDEDFRIYLDTQSQADNLIITAHGGFVPWDGDFRIPDGVTMGFYNPHGTYLADPGIAKVVAGGNKLLVELARQAVTPRKEPALDLLNQGRTEKLSGSRKPSFMADYRLSRYGDDTPEQVVKALTINRYFNPTNKSDILTVRNRKGPAALLRARSLSGVFSALDRYGIKYGAVFGSFCRNNMLRPNRTFDPTQARDV